MIASLVEALGHVGYGEALIFERSENWELIKEIATHPRIYAAISDDFSPPREKWEPIKTDAVWYVIVRSNDGFLVGMFALVHTNAICWQVHTCILPSAWGETAKLAAKQGVEWVWENSPCLRLVTEVPSYNRIALRFAEAGGMKEYGLNHSSYMKGGKLWDVILLGVSKPCL